MTVQSGTHRTGDPEALDDRADTLEQEALRLRQEARRLRRVGESATQWLGAEDVQRLYGISMSTVTAAGRRGELEVGHAGRSPRVSRAALDAWIATRKHPLAKPATNDVDAAYVALARRR